MNENETKNRNSDASLVQRRDQNGTQTKSIGEMSEWAKKDEINKRKQLRLQQVREQSKEIASQIRDKVRCEKERQLQTANAIQQNELLNWKQEQMRNAKMEFQASLSKVGQAHLAAHEDNARTKLIEQQKIKNRKLALQRGKVATERQLSSQSVKSASNKKTPITKKKEKPKKKSVSTQINDSVNSSNMSSFSSTSSLTSSTSSSIAKKNEAVSSKKCAEKLHSEYRRNDIKFASEEDSDIEVMSILSKKNINRSSQFSLSRNGSVSDANFYNSILSKNKTPVANKSSNLNIVDLNGNESSDLSISQTVPTISKVTDLIRRGRDGNDAESNLTPLKSSMHRRSSEEELLCKSPPKPIIVKSKSAERIKSPKPILKKARFISTSPKLQPKPILKKSICKIQKTPKKPAVKQSDIDKRQNTPFHYVPRFTKADDDSSKSSGSKPKVQFYDHANRYGKDYELTSNIVHKDNTIGASALENAIEEAQRNTQHEKTRLQDMAEARKIDEVRLNTALEKEKIRKDYELMTKQLESLTQTETFTRVQANSTRLLSEERIRHDAEQKQAQMNLDFQNILHEPILITCPQVNAKIIDLSDSSSLELNVASTSDNNIKTTSEKDQINTILAPRSSSDFSSVSCSSFLLDYVNARSENISKDIGNSAVESRDDVTALRNLLSKVNSLKYQLQEAIKTYQGNNAEQLKENMKHILKEMENLDREETKLKSGDKQNIKLKHSRANKARMNKENGIPSNELTLREKMLNYKEQCLEEKLKELYLKEKNLKKNAQDVDGNKNGKRNDLIRIRTVMQDKSPLDGNVSNASSDVPVRIVINLNQKNEQKTTKSEMKWDEIIQQPNRVHGKNLAVLTKVTEATGSKFRKTPAKVTKKVVTNIEQTSSTSTTLTAYLSPPNEINTVLTKALRENKKQVATNKRTKQPTGANDVNPHLAHYITRLLAMSRNSVDQLGISSVSTIATPGSSIIETTANGYRQLTTSSSSTTETSLEMHKLPTIDEQKMEQLKKFIIDNQNLVEELNNSLKSLTASESNGADIQKANDVRRMENIWMEMLKNKNKQSTRKGNTIQNQSNSDQAIDPQSELFNKQPAKPQPSHFNKSELISQYDELAANCTKRITDLDSMISKVREEKQKLLENTLSSAGSLINGQGQRENITEYMDFPKQRPNNVANVTPDGDTSQGSDLKSLQTTTSPEYSSSGAAAVASLIPPQRLGMHSKQIGISKDSGIGASRPMTASDFRDSPEFRAMDLQLNPNSLFKTPENIVIPKSKESFEPLLKDIPKVNYRLVDSAGNTLSPQDSTNVIAQNQQTQTSDVAIPKARHPPATLKRYSPQLDDDRPHELSTITEVDTPATSRINATIPHDQTQGDDQNRRTTRSEAIELFYNRFPGFAEYARAHNLNISVNRSGSLFNLSSAGHLLFGEKLNEILDVDGSHVNALKYKSFHSSIKSLNESQANQSGAGNLEYKRFPAHNEYAKNALGLLDSQSLDGFQTMDIDPSINLLQPRDSDDRNESSLPDIIGELQKRNLLKKAFEFLSTSDEQSSTDDLLMETMAKTNPTTATSSIDALEKELREMGIGWASTMLKKSKETNALSSSSSSKLSQDLSCLKNNKTSSPPKSKTRNDLNMIESNSFIDPQLTAIEKLVENPTSPVKDISMNTFNESKPVSLKQFLARELMKHSSTSSSSSSIDSSLASIYFKSFIAASTPFDPSSPATGTRSQLQERQRTSTPVHDSGSITYQQSNGVSSANRKYSPDNIDGADGAGGSGDLTGKLFSGESHISSVRGYSSDTDITFESKDSRSNSKEIDQSINEMQRHKQFEALSIPINMKLSLEKLRSSNSD